MYDYIIVGGGSAGSVMAHRLSARSANKVLLCEAGQDTPPGNEPPEILDSYSGQAYFDPRFHWTELKVTTQIVSHNNPEADRPPLRKYEQARVLGGGSSINGQMANRGAPTDYAEWEARGAAGWNWNDVLPYFKKVERDLDCDGPLHGKDGRIPVRRISQEHWTGHSQAMGEACKLAGFAYPARPERRVRRRLFSGDASPTQDEQRVSAAMGYLDRETRQREQSDDLDRHPGHGAAVRGHALRRRQGAGRRPGAGIPRPRDHPVLRRHPFAGASDARRHRPGRASQGDGHSRADADLPGVGQGLMDHPSIALSSYIRRGARMNEHTRRHIQVGLRYSSGLAGTPAGDMFVAVLSKSAWHAVGEQIASMLTFVNKTYSETGQVKLASRDWQAEPIVEFNLLSDKRDLDRLMSGFRKMAALQMSAPLQAVTDKPFPASYSDRVRKIGVVNTKNKILTSIAARPDGRPAALRHAIDRQLRRRGLHLRAGDERRRGAGSLRAQGGDRRLARLLLLPDGRAPTIRWRWSTPQGRVQAACRACAWSMPRSSRSCPAPTPISRR